MDNRPQTLNWIREKFADRLGDYESLLDTPEGIDELIELVRAGKLSRRNTRQL